MQKLKAWTQWLAPLLIPLLLIVLTWTNPLYKQANKYLETSTTKSAESLAILEDLYLITKASASVKIPIVSGRFEGASRSLHTANKFIALATMAGLANVLLLKLSHLHVFHFALAGILLACLIPKLRLRWIKVLWLLLIINPGLSLFTVGIHWADQKLEITEKDSLHAELQKIHQDFTKKEEARKKKVQARKTRQLDRDKKRGKDHHTLLQKVGDGIGNDVGNAVLHVEEDFAITGKAIHFASKRIKVMVVNYFTSILLLSFLLPITYLLICYRFIKINFPLEVA